MAGSRGETARETIGQADRDQRHQPQDRRTVGDDQQNGGDRNRHRQQREVSTVEGGSDVSTEGRPAGDFQFEVGRAVLGDCAAQVPDDLGVGCVGFAGRDRHEEHSRFAVFAEDGV